MLATVTLKAVKFQDFKKHLPSLYFVACVMQCNNAHK